MKGSLFLSDRIFYHTAPELKVLSTVDPSGEFWKETHMYKTPLRSSLSGFPYLGRK